MHNSESLEGRGERSTTTITELIDAGAVHCRPLLRAGEHATANGPCPLAFLPGGSAPVGGVDNHDDPSQARMVLDNTATHSTTHRPVRVRNHPHGVPTGAHALDLNAATGSKTKGPKRPRVGAP